jgi:hypothetical protein
MSKQEISDWAALADDRYLTSAQLRTRYGHCSDMWVYRRLHDGSGFPQPTTIAGRRFWRLTDLVAWERARAGKSASEINLEVELRATAEKLRRSRAQP